MKTYRLFKILRNGCVSSLGKKLGIRRSGRSGLPQNINLRYNATLWFVTALRPFRLFNISLGGLDERAPNLDSWEPFAYGGFPQPASRPAWADRYLGPWSLYKGQPDSILVRRTNQGYTNTTESHSPRAFSFIFEPTPLCNRMHQNFKAIIFSFGLSQLPSLGSTKVSWTSWDRELRTEHGPITSIFNQALHCEQGEK